MGIFFMLVILFFRGGIVGMLGQLSKNIVLWREKRKSRYHVAIKRHFKAFWQISRSQ